MMKIQPFKDVIFRCSPGKSIALGSEGKLPIFDLISFLNHCYCNKVFKSLGVVYVWPESSGDFSWNDLSCQVNYKIM